MSIVCQDRKKDQQTVDPKVAALIDKYRGYEGGLVPLLQEAQDLKGYLSREVLEQIAGGMHTSLAKVYGVATFYSQFHLKPRGKNIIRVCQGTACHVRGGTEIMARFEKELGVGSGETTPDLNFTLESVACIGACGLAPVITVNDDTHGRLTPDKIPGILEQYQERTDSPQANAQAGAHNQDAGHANSPIQDKEYANLPQGGETLMSNRILICGGTGCISSHSRPVMDRLEKELQEANLDKEYQIIFTGCQGFCEQGPIIIVEKDSTFYCRVDPDQVPAIVQDHLKAGRPVEELLYANPDTGTKARTRDEIGFFQKQKRLVLHNCGLIDPENIDEYIARGGYKALKKALATDPREIIEMIKKSGLRGRGGGGFPTGIKWETTRNAVGEHKYVVCNADEGDPGAFMDRSIMEGDPHAVLEGMLIAGYAIGAQEGYIYIRAEYPLAVRRLLAAIRQAEEKGFIGDKILGSDFGFRMRVKQGAGAFVCGEETALIESIQGNRGMPRPRPPFPAIKGVWDMPTNVNNVETLANIPVILGMGAEEYAKIGTQQSKGTKIFALTGKINNTGLAEVPMGITLREIIYDIGGGIKDGKKFKAVQIGGPSGGCIPEEHLDVAIDYDSLISLGAMMGSGGLVVMDEETCMVDVARFFLTFTRTESCGKCTPCREGTKRLLEILEQIVEGKGEKSDLETLERLGRNIIDTSLCGLGQSAPNPILSTLRYFRSEYELHIEQKVCPAGVCKALKHYRVIPEKCKACGLCKKECPVGAITGEKKVPHVIDPAKCAKCGECVKKCPFEAIVHG